MGLLNALGDALGFSSGADRSGSQATGEDSRTDTQAGSARSDRPHAAGTPVVQGEDLGYTYPDGTVGLDGVDVSLAAGERVAVVGPNGSGKSTLQLLLGGLVEPTAGERRYFGETADPEAVRARLGVLLQDPDDYLFNTTVREDIEYGPAQLGIPRADGERATERLVERLGLEAVLDRPPFRLSGGEKQRAALASVLSFDPDVLLLDEPTGAVDGAGKEQILSLLDEEHARGKTVVTFTPDLELVPRVADRVVLVGPGGTVAARGPVREVLTDGPVLREHGLEPPAVTQVFQGFLEDLPLTVPEGRALLSDRWS